MRQPALVSANTIVGQVATEVETLVRRGRHAAAERRLREQGAACARRGWHGAASTILVLLGRLLAERGRAAAAVRVLESAALPRSDEDADAWVDQQIWMATTCIDAGELAVAEHRARDLRRVLSPETDDRSWATAVLARACLWQGRIDEARALIDECRPGSVEPNRDAFVQATAVRVLVAHGEPFDAGQRLSALVERPCARGRSLAALIVLGARLRFACAVGDLRSAAALLSEAQSLCRELRLPVRAVRLQLLWAEALARSGRSTESALVWRRVRRRAAALPPVLRSACLAPAPAHAAPPRRVASGEGHRISVPAGLATLVEALATMGAHALDDGVAAVRDALGAERVEIWVVDDGPSTGRAVVAAAGASAPVSVAEEALRGGRHVSSPVTRATGEGIEHAVPLRWDGQLVGVLAGRWGATAAGTPPTWLHVVGNSFAGPVAVRALERAEAAAADRLVPEFIGASPSSLAVRAAILRAARSPFAVLIVGESGVGKELVARAIHAASPRASRRFCDVNCAALPEDLVESELFGHARGAFTGAAVDRPGLFEEAHAGTLFLDEIVELSARAQAKLLRVLQQREVRRVGESRLRAVDVRLLSAANRDPRDEAREGAFRHDLLYRVDVVRIDVPPLRARREDVAYIAARLWRETAAHVGSRAVLGRDVLAALADYPWPGNVRELQNVLAGVAVAAPPSGRVGIGCLPRHILVPSGTGAQVPLADARRALDRAVVSAALARAAGQRGRAARELGVSRQGLSKLMARVGLA